MKQLLILAKRVSEKQKEEIAKLYVSGISIENLSKKFSFTKLTISKYLKKSLGESKYKELSFKKKANNKSRDHKNEKLDYLNKNRMDIQIETNNHIPQKILNEQTEEEFFELSQFVEVAPLNCAFEKSPQKDLSSISIADIDFPKTVFMIVDKKVELEIKQLKDYPKWQFLSQNELQRKTIEIYLDLKIAKSFCGKEQKVIKVPNTDVLKLVAPVLRSRGISRIVSSDKLIAL